MMRRLILTAAAIATLALGRAYATAPVVDTVYPTNIAVTSAWVAVSVLSTGDALPEVTMYWGATNLGTTNAGWSYTNAVGEMAASNTWIYLTNLTATTLYYYISYGTNSGGQDWGNVTLFRTLGATVAPTTTSTRAVTVNTNAVLVSPTNLFLPDNTGTNLTERLKAIEAIGVTTNASEIGVALTPTNYTAATPDVEAHAVGIDQALGLRLTGIGATSSTASASSIGSATSPTNLYLIFGSNITGSAGYLGDSTEAGMGLAYSNRVLSAWVDASNALAGTVQNGLLATNAVPKAGGVAMSGGLTNVHGWGMGTNYIVLYGGVLNGTNGIYWTLRGTNFWVLFSE